MGVKSSEVVNLKSKNLKKIIVITKTVYIVLLTVGEERFGEGKLSDLKIRKVCLFLCVF